MDALHPSTPALRCLHCGREVGETMHTRTSYHVDFYTLHAGDVEVVTVARDDDSGTSMTIVKLVRPADFITCAECYRSPQVRAAREQLFRPEVAAAPGDGQGGQC